MRGHHSLQEGSVKIQLVWSFIDLKMINLCIMWVNFALISYYQVNIFPSNFSLINDNPLEMLRFTSSRELTTSFGKPQLFKVMSTIASQLKAPSQNTP